MIDRQAVADELVSHTEIRSLDFTHFGKKYITSRKLSPDGFVQMAYQLAYHQLTGKTVSTYESCMTKQFLHGRTEVRRACVYQLSPRVAVLCASECSRGHVMPCRRCDR
jgi:hypothetical protein